jgi:hypothetical protein
MYFTFPLRVLITPIYLKNAMNKFRGDQTQNRGLYQIVGETSFRGPKMIGQPCSGERFGEEKLKVMLL